MLTRYAKKTLRPLVWTQSQLPPASSLVGGFFFELVTGEVVRFTLAVNSALTPIVRQPYIG